MFVNLHPLEAFSLLLHQTLTSILSSPSLVLNPLKILSSSPSHV
ncbi:hypothetical protein BVRB_8g183790 [Beta vulgaris subsp. vulgaris]|nr:hypothetical protein BVRB_8g183790 [Beta vulgaris subsp. vulgaris]